MRSDGRRATPRARRAGRWQSWSAASWKPAEVIGWRAERREFGAAKGGDGHLVGLVAAEQEDPRGVGAEADMALPGRGAALEIAGSGINLKEYLANASPLSLLSAAKNKGRTEFL